MSAGAGIFCAISEAMRALVKEFPSGATRPDWVVAFINAVGPPSDVAKISLQVDADAADAELWRFLLRTINPTNPEGQIMETLARENHDELENMENSSEAEQEFAAYMAQGLALFKARA